MTQSTLTKIKIAKPTEDHLKTNTTRVAASMFIAALAVLFFYGYLAVQNGAWQLYVLAGLLVLYAVDAALSARMTHLPTDTRAWMVILGLTFILPAATLLLEGVGVFFGLFLAVLVAAMASQTLKGSQIKLGYGVGIGFGILTAGLELLPLNYRLYLPLTQTLLPTFTILVLLLIVFFTITRSWERLLVYIQSSIRNRLVAITTGASLIPVLLISLIIGWATFAQVRSALTQDAFEKLSAVQTIKANQIAIYLADRQGDMVALSETLGSVLNESQAKMSAINTLRRDQIVRLFETWDADVRDVASDPGVIEGTNALELGFQEVSASQVRSLYLGKEFLQAADDGSSYSSAHEEQHGFFSGYIAIHGYKDAFLVDPSGNVVYSVLKSNVYGTNLWTGDYKDSNLALLYQNLLQTPAGKSSIADAAIFEGSYAMFIGTPIYNGTALEGMLIYQLPIEEIDSIMSERTGQGATGDSFLIAMEKDGRVTYRSNRTIVGNGEFVVGYDLTALAPQFMYDALNGITGGQLVIGSVGDVVINAYSPLGIEGINWAVISRVAASEALSPTHLAGEKDFLAGYQETYGYYDIFLIEPDGLIFYSVAKESDYRTNILTGEYKDTNLGRLVAEVKASKAFEFADFEFYAPSGGKPAAFFAIPVTNENNDIVMIIATQTSLEQLNAIMSERTGLGETGETFIIGQDKLRRTETRFLAELGTDSTILNKDFIVDTEASRSVIEGESGQATFNDAGNIPVMASWSPVKLSETEESNPEFEIWGVIAKMDVAEALAPVNQLASTLGLVVGLAVLGIGSLAVLLGARFATNFANPIINLTNTAAQVAEGNMDLVVKTDSVDEIGTLSNAFNTMTSQLRELIGSLEGRVAARTKDLATVAEVGTATATILETDKLLQAVVELSKERFGLYHSHIYLLDETGEKLVLTSGAGEPGRIMAAEKRFIPINREQSLVARAARERKGVIVNDVTQAPDFLPNPLLPHTRSELAVPMIVAGKLIGVFDVQSDQVGRFTESDVNIQTTLAAQVATSIQNVRVFEQAKAQADLETLVNTIGQKIQRTTTVEDTLQTAIREVGLALGAARVSASLQVNREKNKASEN